MNWKFVLIFISAYVYSTLGGNPDKTGPVVGHWNVTYGDHHELCMKMEGGIRLDIAYEAHNESKLIATIVSDDHVHVVEHKSWCSKNSSKETNETMVLDFGPDRTLTFQFTRDQNITGDTSEHKWQLYNIKFDFKYDEKTFPDSKHHHGDSGSLASKDPLKDVIAAGGSSYGCGNPGGWKITNDFTVTMNNLRVQAFMTGQDYGKSEWCTQEQTSDLIPIIIGAALAALVIIVLIAYLVGRARSRTTTYNNI